MATSGKWVKKMINNASKEVTTVYFLPLFSSETVSFFLPVALLLANTLRPFLVAILALKPCLLTLFLLEG